MSGAPDVLVAELLAQSLRAWPLRGRIMREDDGAIRVADGSKAIRVEPAPPGVPFRWMVSIDGRRRGAISLLAVLRQVRAALDPRFAPERVRVALSPLVPQ